MTSVRRRDLLLSGGGAAAALAVSPFAASQTAAAQAPVPPTKWDQETDIVVIGSGATGLPAAIVAREAGASVILVEAEKDIGGHAITSGGNVPLGGGTSVQKKYGIEDSPDLLFRDLTDWSVVEPNGFPDYRYNDREIIRAFADNSAPTFEWLVAHGVSPRVSGSGCPCNQAQARISMEDFSFATKEAGRSRVSASGTISAEIGDFPPASSPSTCAKIPSPFKAWQVRPVQRRMCSR